MRIIQKLAAVVALSITSASPAFAEDVARLGDFVPQLREPTPVSQPRTTAPQTASTTGTGCSVSLAHSEPEFSGCTRAQIESFGGGQRVAQATPAPTQEGCTVSIDRNREKTFNNCSESEIQSVTKSKQRTASADPVERAVKTMNSVEDRRFARDILGTVLGAATDRVFYGRNGGYGRGGSYNSYNRGGGNTRGSGATWNCQAGQYCP